MPSFDLKIRKVKSFNPQLKKFGWATRAIINGTETFESVAEEASRNTTLNKYELAAALGIAAEQFARALKNGFAVDLGPLGKIYPSVTGKWTLTAEEQTKSLLTKVVRFDAGNEIKEAVSAARLSWERLEDDKDDDTTENPGLGDDNTPSSPSNPSTPNNPNNPNNPSNPGSGEGEQEPEEVKADFKHQDGSEENLRGEPGTPLNAPEPDPGYEWEPTPPSVFPDHDTEYHEVEISGGEGDGDDDAGFGR